jgi:hypothetical protein
MSAVGHPNDIITYSQTMIAHASIGRLRHRAVDHACRVEFERLIELHPKISRGSRNEQATHSRITQTSHHVALATAERARVYQLGYSYCYCCKLVSVSRN